MASPTSGVTPSRSLSAVWGWVVGSVGVFGGMTLYIGWQRARIQAAAFGLSPSSLGITDRELVVSGARSATLFFFFVAFAVLSAFLGHKLALHLATTGHRIAALGLVAAAETFVLLQAVIASIAAGDDGPAGDLMRFYSTACWLAFWSGLAYLCWVAALTHPKRLPAPVLAVLRWHHWGVAGAVWLLVVAFTLLESFATDFGLAYISRIERDTSNLPEVRLYAAQDLALTGDTISSSRVPGTDESAYAFVYSNLFLVADSDSALTLIADGWQVDDPVFVVPKSTEIRVELEGGYPLRFE